MWSCETLNAPSSGGGSSPSLTTWNPADKGVNVDLSGGNLIATGGAGAAGAAVVRSTTGVSSGQWYWEIVLTTAISTTGNLFAGLEISSATLSQFVGFTTDSIGIGNNEAVWKNSSSQGSAGTWVQGSNASFAWNAGTKKLWIRVDGGQWNGNSAANDPAAGTGGYDLSTFSAGTYFAAVNVNVPGDVLTAKFSSSSWTYSVPSGFIQFT